MCTVLVPTPLGPVHQVTQRFPSPKKPLLTGQSMDTSPARPGPWSALGQQVTAAPPSAHSQERALLESPWPLGKPRPVPNPPAWSGSSPTAAEGTRSPRRVGTHGCPQSVPPRGVPGQEAGALCNVPHFLQRSPRLWLRTF